MYPLSFQWHGKFPLGQDWWSRSLTETPVDTLQGTTNIFTVLKLALNSESDGRKHWKNWITLITFPPQTQKQAMDFCGTQVGFTPIGRHPIGSPVWGWTSISIWTPTGLLQSASQDFTTFMLRLVNHCPTRLLLLTLLKLQIYYKDEHDTNGFVIEHNTNSIMQCSTMTHTTHRISKSNTCHTSGIAFLRADDTLKVADLGHERLVIFEPGKSFFGLIKIANMQQNMHRQQQGQTDPATMSPNFF